MSLAITCAALALLLVFLVGLYLRLRLVADRALRREAQLIDLCKHQQGWILRGEVACHDCPELGQCVVLHACQREPASATPAAAPPPMAMQLYVPSTWHFIQE